MRKLVIYLLISIGIAVTLESTYAGFFYGLVVVTAFGFFDIPEETPEVKAKRDLEGFEWAEKRFPNDPYVIQHREEINKRYMP